MSKGLETLEKYKRGFATKEYETIEKELKALEIIKEYIKPLCFAPNDEGGMRIWLSGKYYIDLPQAKYDLLKEVLLWVRRF